MEPIVDADPMTPVHVAAPMPPPGAAMAPTTPEADAPRPTTDPSAARAFDGIHVLVIEDVPQVAERIHKLLEDDERVRILETVTDGRQVDERLATLRPDVIVLDALLQGPVGGIGIARRVREQGLRTPIIMITVPDKPLVTGSNMGALETLTMPLAADTLRGTIVRLHEAESGPVPSRLSGTHVLVSARGGVGRTTIAYNLAVAVARDQGARVVLLDGDLQFGDFRMLLGSPPTAASILQLPTQHISADDLGHVVWHDGTGIDVVLAPARLEEADLVTTRDVKACLGALGRIYDVVIVDTATALNDTTLTLLDGATSIINVVTPDASSVRQAARWDASLTAAGYPASKLRLVLNKAGAPGLDSSALSAAVERPIDAQLPFEPLLAGGSSAPGGPIVAARPDAAWSKALVELPKVLATPRP